jgi:hypothetical protein
MQYLGITGASGSRWVNASGGGCGLGCSGFANATAAIKSESTKKGWRFIISPVVFNTKSLAHFAAAVTLLLG